MPRRQGARPRLGLGPVEQPLSKPAAAAQRQQSPRLLPAHAPRVEAVVEQNMEPIRHMRGQLVQKIQRQNRSRHADSAKDEPPPRDAGHQRDADKYEHIDQRAAHIAGHRIDQPHHKQQVRRGHHHAAKALQLPPPLLNPLKLLGEQDDKRDLHNLRRLDGKGHMGNFQPRPISVACDAQRRAQQENENNADYQNDLPVFHQQLHIHHGQQDIGRQADQHRRALDTYRSNHAAGPHVVGSAGDQHHSKQSAPAAKAQQHQIGLLKKIGESFAKTVEHGISYQKFCHFTDYIVYHRRGGM